jgi:hypothetical protein
MRAKPLKRRPRGSLVSVQKALWAVVLYNWGVVEDETCDHESRQRASTALVQAALGWAKVAELSDLETEVRKLETFVSHNGRRA